MFVLCVITTCTCAGHVHRRFKGENCWSDKRVNIGTRYPVVIVYARNRYLPRPCLPINQGRAEEIALGVKKLSSDSVVFFQRRL
jgi:hypothetical protein